MGEDTFHIPIEVIFTVLAAIGGFARYLNGYVNGGGFSWRIFLASGFVSGFGGLMFGLFGQSLSLPLAMMLMMAGVGGFFSEQSLKFLMEYITGKVGKH
jgi:hypothetical protein